MSLGVFSINEEGTMLLHPDAVKLEPTLKKLHESQLLYIIWVYDLKVSPVRRKPLEERRRFARTRFFSNISQELNIEETEIMKKGIEAYRGLNYEEEREICDTYRNKIFQLQKNLLDATLSSDIKNITSTIEHLRKQIEITENSVYETEQTTITVKGDRELSMIEVWQRNRKHFKKLVERI